MTRLVKTLGILGFSSVFLMQGTCTIAEHGFSVLPTTVLRLNTLLSSLNLSNLLNGLTT